MRKLENLNTRTLKILIVASEIAPYAKIGGLGDVTSALAKTLKEQGHDVRIVLPFYKLIKLGDSKPKVHLSSMSVWMGNKEEWCAVFQVTTPENIPVYLIDHQIYFNRDGFYHNNEMHDYDDNPDRFGFFSRAALQLCKDISFNADIIHANDWQTALIPAYLKTWHWNDPILGSAASILTIHNVAYQGIYSKNHIDYLGLGWENFTEEKFESYDKINMLKAGIYYADAVTTVSSTFANEILAPHGGFGLAPYLSRRKNDFFGITNGIDYSEWDPSADAYLPAHFSISNMRGKKTCKRYLQECFDLPKDDSVPLIGTIGRFVDQKGYHLLAACIERIVNEMHVQFVILGTGEKHLEYTFGNLPERYSGKIGSYIGYDNRRAHLIEAGCDFFCMPSLFEPCGLNQMYSQRYGTLPIVRATGGLDETVVNYNESTGDGTGFKFYDPSPDALYYTIGWAISTFYDRPAHFKKMRKKAMLQDFSWQRSASLYEKSYRQAIFNKRRSDDTFRNYYW
jgi:starch synthase